MFEHRYGIVANGCYRKPTLAKLRTTLLQLDELAFAVRSPVRGPIENQHQSLRAFERTESLGCSILIREAERRECLAGFGAASSGRERAR